MWNKKSPEPRGWKCYIANGGVAVVATALLLSGCALLPKEEPPLLPPLVQPAEMKMETTEVKRETLTSSVRGTATLEAVSMAYHQFTQSGYRLEEVLISAGDEVKKGDILMLLQVPGLEMELLGKNLEVEKKRQAVEAVKATGDIGKMKIAMMELQLAEMSLAQTQEKWDNRELKAEIDGVVTFLDSVKPGDIIGAYQTLVIVADPSEVTLSMNVSSGNQVADVEVGMDVKIEYERKEYTGKVVQTPRSAPYVEDERLREKYAKKLYIDPEGLPAEAYMGDFASVEIITAMRENTLTIPKNALRQYFGRVYVQVLDGEQRKEIDVETGLENATSVEILSGLTEGQLVIEK